MKRKAYEELTFTDDFMFWNILTSRPELCKELLELILEVKIKEIHPPEGQKTIENSFDSRGVRLDVYVDDDAGTVYDLEISDEMNDLLDLLLGKPVSKGVAGKIQEAVDQAIELKEWEVPYMTLEMKLREERAEGRAEGRAEEALAKGIRVFASCIKRGISEQEAQVIAELSDEEVIIARDYMRKE